MESNKIFVFLFFLNIISYLIAQESSIIIGNSNYQFSTGNNNGRRIARTYYDRIVVVYTDIIDNESYVMWTETWDSDKWNSPKIIAKGFNPCLTVSWNNDIYLAYGSNSGVKVSWLPDSSFQWQKSIT